MKERERETKKRVKGLKLDTNQGKKRKEFNFFVLTFWHSKKIFFFKYTHTHKTYLGHDIQEEEKH